MSKQQFSIDRHHLSVHGSQLQSWLRRLNLCHTRIAVAQLTTNRVAPTGTGSNLLRRRYELESLFSRGGHSRWCRPDRRAFRGNGLACPAQGHRKTKRLDCPISKRAIFARTEQLTAVRKARIWRQPQAGPKLPRLAVAELLQNPPILLCWVLLSFKY